MLLERKVDEEKGLTCMEVYIDEPVKKSALLSDRSCYRKLVI